MANSPTGGAAPRTDLPSIDDNSAPYWAAARDGVLMAAWCRNCERLHHYPRSRCPFCWSDAVEPKAMSGRATLYTFSTVYVNDLPPFDSRLPYVAAVVELAEGPRLMTKIIDCAPEELRIGMPLRATFAALDDELSATVFRPARDGQPA